MKRKTAGILLGIAAFALTLSGCGENEVTEAVNESVETEMEGHGEEPNTEEAAEEEENGKKADNDAEKTESGVEVEAAEKVSGKAESGENAEGTEAADQTAEGVEFGENSEGTEAADKSAEKSGEDSKTEESESGEIEEADAEVEEAAEKTKVAVLLPESDSWEADAAQLTDAFAKKDCEALIQYAQGDVSAQVRQIQEMAGQEAKALVIAPVDPYGLTDVLAEIKEKGIPVISYDELIMDTDAVKYYTTYDMRKAGQIIGEEIVIQKKLEKAREAGQHCTIEFLMGSPDDWKALFLYNGIMEVLQEYLDDGTLVCTSQKTTFDDTGILRWSESAAEMRMAELLEDFYAETDTVPDIICTGFDKAAYGVKDALESAGIAAGSEQWPFITGVGCEAEAVKNIAGGSMGCSIYMDRGLLAEKCAEMVNTCLQGDTPELSDYEQYDNGIKIIGTCTCEAMLINKDNFEYMVDKGFYTEEEVTPEVTPTGIPEKAEEEEEKSGKEDNDKETEEEEHRAEQSEKEDGEETSGGESSDRSGEDEGDSGKDEIDSGKDEEDSGKDEKDSEEDNSDKSDEKESDTSSGTSILDKIKSI